MKHKEGHLLGLFRVGSEHPWIEWHGDTVRALSDGSTEDERMGIHCDPPGLDVWAKRYEADQATCGQPPDITPDNPCHEHTFHLRVHGPWSGVIPGDGLVPLDDVARGIVEAHLGVSAGVTKGRTDDKQTDCLD